MIDEAMNEADSNFNSHAHVERDPYDYYFSPWVLDFNSHAHVERDLNLNDYVQSTVNFNSHAHVERDLLFCN